MKYMFKSRLVICALFGLVGSQTSMADCGNLQNDRAIISDDPIEVNFEVQYNNARPQGVIIGLDRFDLVRDSITGKILGVRKNGGAISPIGNGLSPLPPNDSGLTIPGKNSEKPASTNVVCENGFIAGGGYISENILPREEITGPKLQSVEWWNATIQNNVLSSLPAIIESASQSPAVASPTEKLQVCKDKKNQCDAYANTLSNSVPGFCAVVAQEVLNRRKDRGGIVYAGIAFATCVYAGESSRSLELNRCQRAYTDCIAPK